MIKQCSICIPALLTISEHQEDPAPVPGAVGHGHRVEPDHDEPPHGQHQGVPGRHRVQDDGEVHVEQEEHAPVVGILSNNIFIIVWSKLNSKTRLGLQCSAWKLFVFDLHKRKAESLNSICKLLQY